MTGLMELMKKIETITPEGGVWCSVNKAQLLATMIIAHRPRVIVEIGVWQGGSLLPMALACRYNAVGMIYAIDPWSAAASVVDEVPANVEWWGSVDHDAALRVFEERLDRHGVASLVKICRTRSDDATPPPEMIDLLHIDGSHTEQAVRDVARYASVVLLGGILVLDDVGWEGGGVKRAHVLARQLGFVDMYPIDSGIAMMRLHMYSVTP